LAISTIHKYFENANLYSFLTSIDITVKIVIIKAYEKTKTN